MASPARLLFSRSIRSTAILTRSSHVRVAALRPYQSCRPFSSGSTKTDETSDHADGGVANPEAKDQEITSREYVKTISELSKARLSALVVSTSSFGFLAAATPISYSTLAAASLGSALCSSSA